MNGLADTWALINNPVVWATFLVAFLCYGLLIRFCFVDRKDVRWFAATRFWQSSIRQMLTALPLLGLLGTVAGLMDTFVHMAKEGELAAQEVVSGGISDALFTTQLGLVLVVPGILLAGLLNHQRNAWLIRSEHEVTN